MPFSLFATPGWFSGWDVVFEFISLVVALLIAAYSWKLYRFNQESRYMYFSLAFVLVALGLGFKIGTNIIQYYTPVRDVAADVFRPLAGPRLKFSWIFYRSGYFLQMVPLLGAWLLLYFISQKPRERLKKYDEVTQLALFVYLVLLISVVANLKYFVYHLTSMVLLGLIVLNYYKNYLNTNNPNTLKVMYSFLFIFIANLLFVFVFQFKNLYVVGELFQLIGFLGLLLTYSSTRLGGGSAKSSDRSLNRPYGSVNSYGSMNSTKIPRGTSS